MKNKNLILISGLLILSAILVACSTANAPAPAEQTAMSDSTVPSNQTPTAAITTPEQVSNPVAANNVEDYSDAKFNSLKGKSPVAIFFHASWDPISRLMDTNLSTKGDKLPQGITVLKADFDKETKLEKEYNVAQQATWIIFDKSGKEVARNPGVDYNAVISDLSKAL